MVALEAAQRGRAVIAARAGALGETVALLGNGLLTPQEDIPALGAAMQRLLSDPGSAQRLGETGRARSAHFFSQDICGARYLALYRELAAPKSRSS